MLFWSLWCAVFGCGEADEPAAEPVPSAQVERRRALSRLGVTLRDPRARVSDRELDRFLASVEIYDRAGLIRGVLATIEVRPGDARFLFGTRPEAMMDEATLRFWTLTADPDVPPGTIFGDSEAHAFYFAHELGHLVHAAAPEGGDRFRRLHAASDPGTYQAPTGDFVSAYAAEDVMEDFAESFSFLTFGQHAWLWGREMRAAFQRPHLARKLLHVAGMIAETKGADDATWPVVFWGAGDGDGDGDEGEPALVIRRARIVRSAEGAVEAFVLPSELDPSGHGVVLGCDATDRCGAWPPRIGGAAVAR